MRLADRLVVMADGVVLQSDRPSAIYSEPATLFVARFVGSPGMNLIEGEVVDANGASAFRPRGTHATVRLARLMRNGPAVLGARPEDTRIDPAGCLAGRVAVDAFHGACRYVHVEGTFGRVAVRRPAEETAAIGAEVVLAFDAPRVKLFDPATGGRLA